MTRAEYQAKYGAPPPVSATPAPVQTPTANTPIRMTHDEYMAKYGNQDNNSPITSGDTTKDGFFSSIVKDPIGSLLVKPAIRTAQAVAAGIGGLTGNQALIDNASKDQTFNVPILGKYLIPALSGTEGVRKIIGEGLNTASYLVPGERAVAAGENLFKGKILKAIGGGALSGAQFGALSGAGQGIQQENPSLGSVLEHTILGTVTGAVGGGVLGAGGAALSKGVRTGLNLFKDTRTPEGLYNRLGDTNAGILNLTKTQINNETRFAKDTPLFIAKEAPDVRWNVSKDGRLDTTPVIDALEPKYHAEAQAFNNALKDSGEYGNLDALQKDMETRARQEFKGTDQESALAKIDQEMLAYKKQYASNVISHNGESLAPFHIIDDIKSDLWGKTKFYGSPGDALASQLNYLMGNSAKTLIENGVKDSPIKAWNQRLGDFASAIKILNQRNGSKVGAGSYSKTGARILGGIAGHTLGGVPGEIAGMVTADQLVKMASDPNVKSYVVKKLIQRMQENGQTGIIEEAQKVMNQRALERGSRKLLPSPDYIPLGPETPPVSGTAVPQKPGGLYEYNQNVEASQKAAGLKPTGTFFTPKDTQGGFIKGADGSKVSNIHPDDKRIMKDFTDYVGGDYKPSAKEAHDLELAASRIAERYNIKNFKSSKSLANEFGRILDDQGLSLGKIAGNPLVAGAAITAGAAVAAKKASHK